MVLNENKQIEYTKRIIIISVGSVRRQDTSIVA